MRLVIAFVILTLLFLAIERRWIFRRERITDILYWFFTPLVTKTISRLVIVIVVVLSGGSVARSTWFTAQPVWLQFILLLVASDLIGYGSHRLFHGKRLWPFHAIHHSSETLDWLAATRLHPVNEIGTRLLQVLPLYLLGFRGDVVAGLVPFLTLYAIFLHANVSWDFGLLRWIIASPRFHRWHHAIDAEGNYAGLFPWIDLLFGTFYMPGDRRPERFGVREPVPAGLLGQLGYPFKRRDDLSPPTVESVAEAP